MKKNYIYSAILGGAFFAVPYVALGIELLPSLAISAVAYGAGILIFKGRSKLDLSIDKKNLYDILKEAKEETLQISNISKQIEDKEVVENISYHQCSQYIRDKICTPECAFELWYAPRQEDNKK